MTPRQQTLIQDSWSRVVPIADVAATAFYDRLFELDPDLRALFAHTDMARQKQLLVQTLAVVVKSIDRLEQVVPAVQALGRRHAGYGVEPADFATVGQALLDTLAFGLGEAFDDEVRAAWTAAYTTLAEVMIGAMGEAEAAA
jgi:hemoglobin-like flavoprotein